MRAIEIISEMKISSKELNSVGEFFNLFQLGFEAEMILDVGVIDDLENLKIDDGVDQIKSEIIQNFSFRVEEELGEIECFGSYHQKSKNPSIYTFEPDGSITTDLESGLVGVEIVSPLFKNVNECLDNIKKVFSIISIHGRSDESTGFHVSISFKEDTKINLLKMMVLVGENYIAKFFGRDANDYCLGIKRMVSKSIGIYSKNLITNFKSFERVLITNLADNRNSSVNISDFIDTNGRIEFRMMGGVDYHTKYEQVEQAIKRFMYAINVATIPNFDEQNYRKKLGKIVLQAFDKNRNKYATDESNNNVSIYNLTPLMNMKGAGSSSTDIMKNLTVMLANNIKRFEENRSNQNSFDKIVITLMDILEEITEEASAYYEWGNISKGTAGPAGLDNKFIKMNPTAIKRIRELVSQYAIHRRSIRFNVRHYKITDELFRLVGIK